MAKTKPGAPRRRPAQDRRVRVFVTEELVAQQALAAAALKKKKDDG